MYFKSEMYHCNTLLVTLTKVWTGNVRILFHSKTEHKLNFHIQVGCVIRQQLYFQQLSQWCSTALYSSKFGHDLWPDKHRLSGLCSIEYGHDLWSDKHHSTNLRRSEYAQELGSHKHCSTEFSTITIHSFRNLGGLYSVIFLIIRILFSLRISLERYGIFTNWERQSSSFQTYFHKQDQNWEYDFFTSVTP